MLETVISKLLDWFSSREKAEITLKPKITTTSTVSVYIHSETSIEEIRIEVTNVGKTPIKIEGMGFYDTQKHSYCDEELTSLDVEKQLQLPVTLGSKEFFSFKIAPRFYRDLISDTRVLTVRGDGTKFWKIKKSEVTFHKNSIQEGLKESSRTA